MVSSVRTIDKRKESVNEIEKAEENYSLPRIFLIDIILDKVT